MRFNTRMATLLGCALMASALAAQAQQKGKGNPGADANRPAHHPQKGVGLEDSEQEK